MTKLLLVTIVASKNSTGNEWLKINGIREVHIKSIIKKTQEKHYL